MERFEKFIAEATRIMHWQNSAWRSAALRDMKEFKCSPFTFIYRFLRTYWNDYQTWNYYRKLSKDPQCWVYLPIEHDDYNFKKYRQWSAENNMPYTAIFGSADRGIDAAYGFESKEAAMAFKLTFLA